MHLEATDRRAQVAGIVLAHFGKDGNRRLNGEPYLLDALYRWLLTVGKSVDTWRTYAERVQLWADLRDKRSLSAMVNTRPREISDFLFTLESQGAAPRTIKGIQATLQSWFRWLHQRELIAKLPITREDARMFRVDHQRIQKADGSRQSLTLDQAQQVAEWCLSEAVPVAGLAVLLQMSAGLRSQEVASLERRALTVVDGVTSLVVPGKGGKSRQIVLETVVVHAWERYWADSRRQGLRGPLLRAPGGGFYDRKQIQRWAKLAAAVVGRREAISSHDLRKTAATLLMQAGARLEQVQAHLGHSSSETTLRCYVTKREPLAVTTGIRAPLTQKGDSHGQEQTEAQAER